jgi:alpha-tubulin suppressor-like RCC1 family protein
VACGAEHVVALASDGRLFSWGQNENGQLGLGDNRQRQSPREIYTFPSTSKVVKDVTCGHTHTLAVTSTDELFAWGCNGHGQLGLGHPYDRNSPQRVEALCQRRIRRIAAGAQHSLVFVEIGGLHSFGCNDHGQLGLGTNIGSRVPAQVALLKEAEIVSVGAGVVHSAAVSSTGACYTWGGGIRGQLGHGRFEESLLPEEVVLSGFDTKEAKQVLLVY